MEPAIIRRCLVLARKCLYACWPESNVRYNLDMHLSRRARRCQVQIESPAKDSRSLLSALIISSTKVVLTLLVCLMIINCASASKAPLATTLEPQKMFTDTTSIGVSGGGEDQKRCAKLAAVELRYEEEEKDNNATLALPSSDKERDGDSPKTSDWEATADQAQGSSQRMAISRKRVRFKRRALRSRPQISRKILKKITPTKVLIGAHLGSFAYRRYANGSNSTTENVANATMLTGLLESQTITNLTAGSQLQNATLMLSDASGESSNNDSLILTESLDSSSPLDVTTTTPVPPT